MLKYIYMQRSCLWHAVVPHHYITCMQTQEVAVTNHLISLPMARSSELVYGSLEMHGWPPPPTSSCSAAGPGCISASHNPTQEGGHHTSVHLRSGLPCTHTAAHTFSMLQACTTLHVPLLLVGGTQLFSLLPLGRGSCYSAHHILQSCLQPLSLLLTPDTTPTPSQQHSS